MRRGLLPLLACACSPIAPPPILPRHATTAPLPEKTAMVTWIVGYFTQGIGGSGFGTEVRLSYQATDELLVGLGLGGGSGSESGPSGGGGGRGHWLLAARAFATFGPGPDWVAMTGGVGVTGLDTGHVAFTLDGGAAVSRAGGDFHPHAGVFAALSLPMRLGEPFGGAEEAPTRFVHLGGSFGGVWDAARDNAGSLELAGAYGFETSGPRDGPSFSLSVADAQVVAEPD
jgi:hypothetical protein